MVAVELRKMFDTRSGFWLMMSVAITATLATGAVILWAPDSELTYDTFAAAIGFPMSVILPMVAILSVTSEWTQRSGLSTFTLVPHRGRVIWAKAVGAVLIGVGSMVVAMAIGALGNIVGTAITGTPTIWDDSFLHLSEIVLANVLGMLIGFTLGVVIRNSAGAIVGYFVFTLVLPDPVRAARRERLLVARRPGLGRLQLRPERAVQRRHGREGLGPPRGRQRDLAGHPARRRAATDVALRGQVAPPSQDSRLSRNPLAARRLFVVPSRRGHPLTTSPPPPLVVHSSCRELPMSATLTLSRLDVAYGARTLVRGLDLVVAPGDVTALVGANGSGKSSLMRTVVGELPVESGSVRLSPPDATIGWLPQSAPDPTESLLDYARRRTGVAAADQALHDASSALAAGDAGVRRPLRRRPRALARPRRRRPRGPAAAGRRPARSRRRTRTDRSGPCPAARPPAPPWPRSCSAATRCCCSTSRRTTWTRPGWS